LKSGRPRFDARPSHGRRESCAGPPGNSFGQQRADNRPERASIGSGRPENDATAAPASSHVQAVSGPAPPPSSAPEAARRVIRGRMTTTTLSHNTRGMGHELAAEWCQAGGSTITSSGIARSQSRSCLRSPRPVRRLLLGRLRLPARMLRRLPIGDPRDELLEAVARHLEQRDAVRGGGSYARTKSPGR